MDKLDKKIKSIMNSSNFQESDKFHSTVTQTLEKLPNKKQHKFKNFKIALATACCSLLLVTGIVFAEEIKQYIHKQFNSGKQLIMWEVFMIFSHILIY